MIRSYNARMNGAYMFAYFKYLSIDFILLQAYQLTSRHPMSVYGPMNLVVCLLMKIEARSKTVLTDDTGKRARRLGSPTHWAKRLCA